MKRRNFIQIICGMVSVPLAVISARKSQTKDTENFEKQLCVAPNIKADTIHRFVDFPIQITKPIKISYRLPKDFEFSQEYKDYVDALCLAEFNCSFMSRKLPGRTFK